MKKKETFIAKYIEFELLEGRQPNSVYEFCKKFKSNEASFYEHFNSIDHLKKIILVNFVNDTIDALDTDKDYESYSGREKLLAFFYTLFENFKENRSYLITKYKNTEAFKFKMEDWNLFFLQFNARIEAILNEAKSVNEIASRPYISSHYSKIFKVTLAYVFRVWVNDESKDFETTDAAIEKAVNSAFELLSAGPLDTLLDFGKFALKTKIS